MGSDNLRFDAIIFDVGGTLIGFSDWVPFQEFLASVGLPATEADGRQLHLRFLRTITADRDKAQGLGADEAGLDAWWQGIFRTTWPGRQDLADAMFRAFRADTFDRVLPDVVPTLTALRGLGLPLGILSNFTADLDNLLRRLGLRDWFGFVIASAQVGVAKPDRRIFDLAVSRANRPRHRLLYVGDHVGDDIEGAEGAGLNSVLIDRVDRYPRAACPRIRSLHDLIYYVRVPTRPAPGILLSLDEVMVDLAAIPPTAGRPAVASLQIVPLLHNLWGRGYRLGLVSGGAREVVEQTLHAVGVADLFEVVVGADQLRKDRPDPERYLLAAAGLGLAPPDCLLVASALPDIRSARLAGMACVAVATVLPAAQVPGVDRVFEDLDALSAWLLSVWPEPF